MSKKRTIVARLPAGRCRVRILSRGKIVLFTRTSRRAGGHIPPPSPPFSGYRRPELEFDHSSPSNAEVKND